MTMDQITDQITRSAQIWLCNAEIHKTDAVCLTLFAKRVEWSHGAAIKRTATGERQ